MVSVLITDTATQVWILDEAVCIAYCTNTFGKGIDPTISPPAIGKNEGRLDS